MQRSFQAELLYEGALMGLVFVLLASLLIRASCS